jgi:hypothetical protein
MEATLANGSAVRSNNQRFHLWMAVVFLSIAFGGFIPTYWARVADGTFHEPPIVHIHGVLLFTWTLFYFIQTAWIASGRTRTHRAWGLAGIALFSVLVCSIIATKITIIRLNDARGFGDADRRFSAVAFGALPLIIGLFAVAIAKVNKPETHKRLMFVLMAAMMTPAVARVFLTFLAPAGAADNGPPPAFVSVPPTIVGLLLIVIAIGYDWRRNRKPHPVYVYGALLIMVESIGAVLFSSTQAWMSTARFLEGLGG